jgi:hypothetical protein
VNRRFLLGAAVIIPALFLQTGCRVKRTPEEIPSPTPKPTPAVIYVPAKHMETGKLFNGMQINATVETENGNSAEEERDTMSSYTLNLQLKVRVPKPNSNLQDLEKLNPYLPKVLPWLEASLPKARVAPFYDDFYRLKVNSLNRDLVRLDQLISRQHFFDCETVLELEGQPSKRRALLVQAAMEVDTDGSDSDRVPNVDGNSSTYQPMTSYKWAKKTDKENPFLASSEERLKKLTQELSARITAPERSRDLNDSLIPEARYEITQLKKSSFLVAAADPYIVIPYLLMSPGYEPYAPKVGDYCVVIYNDTLYPAIIGDVGPNYKIGEASLRICKEINALSNSNNRPVSDLRITYLIFPNTADKPFDVPDLGKWHARCDQFLNEMGGYKGELKAWEDVTKPKPTPTPTPAPTASPATSPPPSASPSATPQVTPQPGASPSAPASVTPSASIAPSPVPSPAPSPSASASPGA